MKRLDSWKLISPGLLSVGIWLGIAWLEIQTGFGIRLGPAYVIPAAIIGWCYGYRFGSISAIILIATWQTIDAVGASRTLPLVAHIANLMIRTTALGVVSLGSAWARYMLERQKRLTVELQKAIEKVQVLEGLLPICAWCKRVRNDRGTWELIEAYVSEHSNATWTHSICPECKQKMLREEQITKLQT